MTSSDDFNIELGQSVRRHIEQKKSPLENGRIIALPQGSPEKDRVPIFIAERVMRLIDEHVGSMIEKEVGGVLLGGYYQSGKSTYIEITDFIEAKAAVGTDVSLTFTHETWAQLNEEHSHKNPDSLIVGWYHSHPGLGVFMSKEDEFIHSNYFSELWHVALVVDPVSHDWGCFRWDNDVLVRTEGYYIYGDKKSAKNIREYIQQVDSSRKALPPSASANAHRDYRGRSTSTIPLWIVIGVLVLAQAVTCFFLFLRKLEPAQIDYYSLAIEQLSHSDLTGGEFYLRRELSANPRHPQAMNELKLIETILGNTSVAKYDNHRLDLVCFRLFIADRLVEGGVKVKEKSGLDEIKQWFSNDSSLAIQSYDPCKDAFKVYHSADKSYSERLSRAVLIAKIAVEYDKQSPDKAWYKSAVDWLEDEALRRTAYGISIHDEDAQKQYNRMTSSEKKSVTRLKANMVRSKKPGI